MNRPLSAARRFPAALVRRMPWPLKLRARKLYYLPIDIRDRLLGRRDPLTPPRRLSFVGGGDFKAIGDEFMRYFVALGGLQPDGAVLDVGCGIGRMAVPLTGYLGPRGRYEGFDIMADGIRWCQRAITPRHPNFRFQQADIYNKMYRPQGARRACDYSFPYADGAFDLALATSVFTHLLPADLERYLAEIARVLKPGGRCLITMFLANQESLALVRAGKSLFAFEPYAEHCYTTNPATPEAAVAYDETFIRGLFDRHGLEIAPPIRYGAWSGRADYLSSQDIVVAARRPAADR